MRNRWLVLGALFVALAPASARAQSLRVGSPAPALSVAGFVKGQPVKSFQKGKVYVVEFWATWCGPCMETIPHLTALQKKYPQVTFVGVSVWEENQADVRPFVKRMGNQMAYRVATDKVPAGTDARKGKMARTWMEAAGQDGIPTAFIVNGAGKIAWIGHPVELTDALPKVAGRK